MILSCPRCMTRYVADPAHFSPPGRNVRCAKCGNVWFQGPPGPESEPEPEPSLNRHASTAEAIERTFPDAGLQKHRGLRALFVVGASWVALIALVTGVALAGVKYRESIASLWPQTATIFAAIGMPVNLRGLDFAGVTYYDRVENGELVLSIAGELRNITSRPQPVPRIRISLRDNANRELYYWTFDTGVPMLAPGAHVPFLTRLASPPRGARHVDVRFARDGE